MEKAFIPVETLVDGYLSACRSAGMSPRTIRGHGEKLRRYVRVTRGTLGDFTLAAVREHLLALQKATKWDGHPYIPPTKETPSTTTIRNRACVLAGFASWLDAEEYTDGSVLSRLRIPKPND